MDSSLKSESFKVIEDQFISSNMITFKWLSRRMEIHNSVAKRLLQEYLDEAKDRSKYVVTLVIYGKKEKGDLLLSLVKESDFSSVQKSVSVIDKHIYSIQRAESTFSPDVIYGIDKATYEVEQLSLASIKYNKEIVRGCASVQSTPLVKSEKSVISWEKSTPEIEEKVKLKNSSPQKTSPRSETLPNKSNREATNGKPGTKKSIIKPLAGDKGSISSFFQKQAAKGSVSKTLSISNGLSNSPNDSSEKEEIEINDADLKNSTTELDAVILRKDGLETNGASGISSSESSSSKKIESKENAGKRTKISSKSKKRTSKRNTKQKKLKRIIVQSDSSEDEEASGNESHLSEPEPEEEPEPFIESSQMESPAVIISHGKKRKRKIVENTAMDDDGFLHTSKEVVYESCSSDEDENKVSNNENLDRNKRLRTDENFAQNEEKETSEKTTKIQNHKTKQSSIKFFFQKPQKT